MRKGEFVCTSNIKDDYYDWLLDLVGSRAREYSLLIKTLHKINFHWTVPNDDNRAYEGKNLREQFLLEGDIPFKFCFEELDFECTMLEVIIALGYRCESIMADRQDSKCMSDWFWILLCNCGLNNFTDECFYDRWNGQTVYDVITKIIDRTYDRNGKGGLFPLKKSKKDQRKVELWYQMSTYLVENFYTESMFL